MTRVRFPTVQSFPHLHSIQTDSGANRASYAMGIRGPFPGRGVKQQGRENDHVFSSRTEVNEG